MNIKIYSTPICPYCQTLKAFLQNNGFEYEDIDVSSNEEERKHMIEISNQMSVPVVEIEGEVIVGFDKNKISELLNIKK